MSYATRVYPQHMHPDALRIVALSAAIALNAGMMLVAMRPLAADFLRPAPPRPPPTLFVHPAPVPPVPQPPQPDLKPLPRALPTVTAPRVPVASPEPSAVSTPAPAVITAPVTHVATPTRVATAVHAAPATAALAYLDAPAPTYPMQARHLHMQGTVVLRVQVDSSGHPLQVQVERSSGYPLLDRSARTQVLEHWRFQPAQMDGHAVNAWARVPITFNLQSL